MPDDYDDHWRSSQAYGYAQWETAQAQRQRDEENKLKAAREAEERRRVAHDQPAYLQSDRWYTSMIDQNAGTVTYRQAYPYINTGVIRNIAEGQEDEIIQQAPRPQGNVVFDELTNVPVGRLGAQVQYVNPFDNYANVHDEHVRQHNIMMTEYYAKNYKPTSKKKKLDIPWF